MNTKIKKSIRSFNEEIEAMTIICNIQAMQNKIYGESFQYDQFNGNTLDELRNLQDSLIPLYNNSLK